MLSTQIINLNILNKKLLPNLIKFLNFCVVVYVLCTSPLASQAATNDLHFMQQLFKYIEVDELCATTALNAFSCHFCYLTRELFLLCLFSNKLTTTRKEDITTENVIHQLEFTDSS